MQTLLKRNQFFAEGHRNFNKKLQRQILHQNKIRELQKIPNHQILFFSIDSVRQVLMIYRGWRQGRWRSMESYAAAFNKLPLKPYIFETTI